MRKLTQLFQVVEVSSGSEGEVFKTCRTQEECEKFLNSEETARDFSDYMSDIQLTIRPIWTNAREDSIQRMLKE